jgi:hypothetical protein
MVVAVPEPAPPVVVPIAPPEPKPIDPTIVARPLYGLLAEVAAAHGCSVRDLQTYSRLPQYVAPRREFYYRALAETSASSCEIGRVVSRDHSSVLSGSRRHCALNGLVPPRGAPAGVKVYSSVARASGVVGNPVTAPNA